MRILAVADSDSYLKWAAWLLNGTRWEVDLTVVRSPIVPSARQAGAAVAGTRFHAPPVLSMPALRRRARKLAPDAVLLACTGPVVDVLAGEVFRRDSGPVLATGLPGISVPATEKAWLYRSGCDLFIVHSAREVDEFAALGAALGAHGRVALARLPFLVDGTPARKHTVVFAAQAKVPARREEREAVLLALAELADRRPDLGVVVKLRAAAGERQTHNERHPYETLWAELAQHRQVRPGALRFETGSMRERLADAAGFVTVSSTAALEAIATSVPSLVLSDFGVNDEMINSVFEGSGLLGTLEDLAKGSFRTPDPAWCERNYFHESGASDWAEVLERMDRPHRHGSLLDGPEYARARRRARLRLTLPPKLLRLAYRVKRNLDRGRSRASRRRRLK